MTTIGSLFSGIAGLERGLESVIPGARVIWQAESDPAARAVLERWYPGVRRYNDVREIDGRAERPDIICGGFPCQDISVAGAGAGIGGARSGLWREFARIVRALKPDVVFVENVPALASRGLDEVLRDLAEGGFDATWDCFKASDVGAPHQRERLFVLAYADGDGIRQLAERDQRDRGSERAAECQHAEPIHHRAQLADAAGAGRGRSPIPLDGGRGEATIQVRSPEPHGRGEHVARHRFPPGPAGIDGWDGPVPALRRSAARVPAGMDRGWRTKNRIADRLRLLGNACCPQQAALAFETLAARVARSREAA